MQFINNNILKLNKVAGSRIEEKKASSPMSPFDNFKNK